MKRTFIRFQLHRVRTDKNGLAPIKVIYELSDKANRTTLPTGKKVRPENWQGGKAVFLTRSEAKKFDDLNYDDLLLKKEVDELNSDLQGIAKELRDIEKNFVYAGKNYTIYEVVEEYKKRQSEQPQAIQAAPKIYIADYIENYIIRNEKLIQKGTLNTYRNLLKILQRFGERKENRLTFAGLTKHKLDNLLAFYIDNGYNNAYTSKHFSILKRLIKEAIKENEELEVKQDFREYTPKVLKSEEADVFVLTENEFNQLLNLDLTDLNKIHTYYKIEKGTETEQTVSFETLEKVRNLFIFSCATGFRFSDLMDLKREHIKSEWIIKRQVKGGKVAKIEIPLNDLSKYILSLYEDLETPLPEISNQKANEYIKQIGILAGINTPTEKTTKTGTTIKTEIRPKHELMTMHMGRRVFASLSLAKGAAIQNVMSLTGHRKLATFKRYMRIDDKQKQEAMSVWNESIKLKAVK